MVPGVFPPGLFYAHSTEAVTTLRMFGWQADQVGCGIIRIEVPLTELRNHGHDTGFSEKWSKEWMENLDTVIAARTAKDAPSMLWRRVCSMNDGPFCVYETDDDLLNLDPSVTIPYEFWTQPNIVRNYRNSLQLSHRVVTTTDYLANVLSKMHPDVRVAPNSVPSWVVDLPSKARTDGRITLGWGGSNSHHMDWTIAHYHVRAAIVRNKEAEFHTMGWDYGAAMNLPPDQHRHTTWLPVYDSWRAIDFHIGVLPLKNHVFNLSKSPIKAIECAARGVPVVASSVGPYKEFVKHGETGFLVNNSKPQEWRKYLTLLIKDHSLREQMGQAAKTQAKEHTIEHLWPQYERAYTP